MIKGIGQYTIHKTLPSLGEVGLACKTGLERTIHSWIVFSKYFHYGHTHVWKPLVMEAAIYCLTHHLLTFKFGVLFPHLPFPISHSHFPFPISHSPFPVPTRVIIQLQDSLVPRPFLQDEKTTMFVSCEGFTSSFEGCRLILVR